MPDEKEMARILLEKGAVSLNVREPYTFVSGIRSPIYCDNRRMLGFPDERRVIVDAFIESVQGLEFDVLVGTATAGIPWAGFIAQKLDKPMAYVRADRKDHGAGNRIEGAELNGKKAVVIEDLVSTGESSIRAVEAVRSNGADVVAVAAIFAYGFERARKGFEDVKCDLIALSNFSSLVEVAGERGVLTEEELDILAEWNKDPSGWGPKHGFQNKDEEAD